MISNESIHLSTLLSHTRSLLAKINSYPVEINLRRAGVGHASQIFTYTSARELHALYDLARNCRPGATILEVGSYLGASSCYLAAATARIGGTVYCVDTWQNETMMDGEKDTYDEFLRNTEGARSWLVPVRKRSERLSEADIPTPIDLVFIDGDHNYEAVKSDFLHISPWLAKDGVIAFHDSSTHEGVSRTIGEALISGTWVIKGCVDNLCWIRRV